MSLFPATPSDMSCNYALLVYLNKQARAIGSNLHSLPYEDQQRLIVGESTSPDCTPSKPDYGEFWEQFR